MLGFPAGLLSSTGFLLASPLTTPRNTPRSTPIPHRLLLEEAAPELAGLVQSLMSSSNVGSGGQHDEQHVFLREGEKKKVF